MKIKTKFGFLAFLPFLLLFSCDKTDWQETPPEEFQGIFYEVSEPVIQGYQKPIVIEIKDDELRYTSVEDEQDFHLPIVKVSKTDKRIIIFCGDSNESHIADYRYQVFWGEDNYLHISQIVDTGYNNEDGNFPVGKFTNNQYLKHK